MMEIARALEHIKSGKPLIITDHEDRENEGDLFVPAEKVTPQIIKLMIRRGGGLICCAITRAQAARLDLPLMIASEKNTEKTGVNFTVSVSARSGVTTGVSAYDRARTIQVLADPTATNQQLAVPGHVFGLVARDGGVIERRGHTEAAVDLARLAGLKPSGVLCEIVGESGEMAKKTELEKLSSEISAPIISIDQIVEYLKVKPLPAFSKVAEVSKVAQSQLPTIYGVFELTIYRSSSDHSEHVALSMGKLDTQVTTRIHSMCLTGDTFGSLRCDCQTQLHRSMKILSETKNGLILYLNQEGRGIGLTNKIKAYGLQDQGLDTFDANCKLGLPIDARDYKIAADILKCKKISKIRLLSNNPDKAKQLKKRGIEVELAAHETEPNDQNRQYLLAKKTKMGHKLNKV